MSHIYVTDNGSTLSVSGGRLVVTNKKEVVKSIPKKTIESISIFGNTSITTPCIQYLLTAGIPTTFFSSRGRYYGRLESTSHSKVDVLHRQFTLLDNTSYSLEMAKKIISAKINNQIVVLRRYIKKMNDEFRYSIDTMRRYIRLLNSAEDVNAVLGYEGITAKIYFESLGKIIKPEFYFMGRNRRPPRDKFNSLLSLGYTLLMYEIYGELESVGLTPYYGVFHKAYKNNPALASDLMEEWRAVAVDSTVLSLIQGNEIGADEFHIDEEGRGIYLTNDGLKKIVDKYEKKMNSNMKYLKYDNATHSIREAISIQCSKFRAGIMKESTDEYQSITLR